MLPNSRLSVGQRAKASLRHVRFSSGRRFGPFQLSPQISRPQRQALEFWIARLPVALRSRLPELKLAVADELHSVRRNVFINERPPAAARRTPAHTHAVSFIPERYVVLDIALFRRRVELGRILYHELCHFLWPRLGNPKRRSFGALLRRELRERVRGELGYSAEHLKASLDSMRAFRTSQSSLHRLRSEYFCESFCDTGSFVLLGNERRERHSEYTLRSAARERRAREWARLVLGDDQWKRLFKTNNTLAGRSASRRMK